MSNLCVFLNTRTENSGALAQIGDKGLSPFRYLFNGKTIRIQDSRFDNQVFLHHVASFHKKGNKNYSSSNCCLESSSTSMIKAALSVVFLLPGLMLGAAFKGLGYYLSSKVRENHRLTKEHLTLNICQQRDRKRV